MKPNQPSFNMTSAILVQVMTIILLESMFLIKVKVPKAPICPEQIYFVLSVKEVFKIEHFRHATFELVVAPSLACTLLNFNCLHHY